MERWFAFVANDVTLKRDATANQVVTIDSASLSACTAEKVPRGRRFHHGHMVTLIS